MMKTLSLFFTLMIACLLCVGPAAADGYMKMSGQSFGENQTLFSYEAPIETSEFTFTAPDGFCIVGMDLYVGPGDACNWTLYTNEYTVDGWWQYDTTGPLGATGSLFTAAVESDVQEVSAAAPGIHYPELFGVCPGFKYSGEALDYCILSQGVYTYAPFYKFGISHVNSDQCAYQEINPLIPVRTVQITNYEPVGPGYNSKVYYLTEDRALDQIELHHPGQAYCFEDSYGGIDFLELLEDIYGLLGSAFFILVVLEYLFVEHFFEVIMLYEVILIAYSAYNSRDIIQFSKKFIKANQALFDYLVKMVEALVGIITKIINALKPV